MINNYFAPVKEVILMKALKIVLVVLSTLIDIIEA
jgi:hypothetical protein